MELLAGVVRRYAWGTPDVVAELLGVEPDGEPQAELWLGAHPDSPARLPDGRGLDAVVLADPSGVLGPRVERAFGPRLPYLLKLLSAAAPLSLQVHPSEEQARAGFAAEEAAGVPRDAPHRRYRDPHHKPEMIVATTPFEALCGIRPLADVLADVEPLAVDHPLWVELVTLLRRGPDGDAQQSAVALLLGADDPGSVSELVGLVSAACAGSAAASPRTAAELAATNPGDPGVVVSLLLQRISLIPGEALHLPAGNVHAYLRGTGVEVMAASDNVLRAGLTPKFVDVEELLRLVDFAPRPVPRVVPQESAGLRWYRPGAAEFALAVVDPAGSEVVLDADGPRLVLVLSGGLVLTTADDVVTAERGSAHLVRDSEGPLTLTGAGVAVVAVVP